MIPRVILCCAALLGAARAGQPGAAKPVAAPMRDLKWGQLNFLHTTDTHGWLGGHLLEPQYSADWGDYVSFAAHMRKQADDKGVDLLLIDTGDRVEGNGLYDGSKPKGLFTYDIIREQHIDLLCIGNHELYQADAAGREYQYTVPNFKDNYLASNLDYVDVKTDKRSPLAQRYKKFKTKNQGLEIVSFGFLFNFGGNANNTIVQPVEETIKEEWFQQAIRERPDLFIVIGHVGLRMPEFKAIFTAIRKQNWYTPIAFFGGHAHVRDALSFDKKAFAMASGRYMETIGWMSIDGVEQKKEEISSEASTSFSRRYIDNNLFGLYHHSGLNETTFPTKQGKLVSSMIARARDGLGLDYQFGCSPRDLWMSRAEYPGNGSIYTWLETEVLPGIVVTKERKDVSRLAILNTGGIRFDIFKGPFTKDSTYIVSPFVSSFSYVPDVPYGIAKKVLALLNNGKQILETEGLDPQHLNIPQMMYAKELSNTGASEVHVELRRGFEQQPLGSGEPTEKPDLIGGYTTKDDVSSDGDDTIHSPLKFYSVPNCVQAEIAFPEDGQPDKVDLVFIDFIQPWIIVALKLSGGDYADSDVKAYDEGTFTYKMAEWIKENWKGDC